MKNDTTIDCNETVNAVGIRCSALLAIATAALERIAKCEDAPEIDATGESQTGLHCGLEDRYCRDRYEGADYGHTVGVEKGLEWASNEAKHALEQMANDQAQPLLAGSPGWVRPCEVCGRPMTEKLYTHGNVKRTYWTCDLAEGAWAHGAQHTREDALENRKAPNEKLRDPAT